MTDMDKRGKSHQVMQEVLEEAREEGYPKPSEIALKNAESILQSFWLLRPDLPYEIYPTGEGEVIVDCPAMKGYSVIVICLTDGSLGLLRNTPNNKDSESFRTIAHLSIDTLSESLRDFS